MLQANSVALVKASTPAARLRTALGVQAAAQAVGLALGPTVGAALVAGLGWRWTYWINVPVGLIALAAGHYLLPRTRDRAPVRRFDRAGVLWLATGRRRPAGRAQLPGSGHSVLVAGTVLTALPAGFVLGAVGGDRALPASVTDRARCLYGAALSGVAPAALLLLAPTPVPLACALGVLGLGLGLFTPANNTLVMRAVPTDAPGTGGGLINMARGLGTAIGVALVTLAPHRGGGGHLAVLILLAAAVAMAVAMAVAGSGRGTGAAPSPAAAAERE